MAAVGDDCYFFCTSTCAKGVACPFRHVEAAKTCKIICQHWQTSGCFRPMCKFRHSDFHIPIINSEVPCYWETQPVGCSKPNCMYKHSKPRPDSKSASPQGDPASSPTKDSQSEDKKESTDVFVMPTVKPVIIDPESEASNSSPVKHPPPKVTKEDEVEENGKNKKTSQKKNSLKVKEKSEVSKAGVKQKKVAKVTNKKKKTSVLTQKNGKSSSVVEKKVKNEVTKKLPVKRKKVEEPVERKPAVPVKKRIKDRLGVKSAPVSTKKDEESDEDESSDSDDSIENVKVLSMEEIFRQKALESMMKKRAADGKSLLPEYGSSRVRNTSRQPVKSRIPDKPKKPVRKPPTPPPESESEDEDEEEETEEEEEETDEENDKEETEEEEEEDEEEKSESSKSSSDSSSSASSESEEESEVRRVVINLDAEKAARKRAKESLLKKPIVNRPVPSAAKIKERKVISDKTQDSPFSNRVQRVSAKDRLGIVKPITSTSDSIARKGGVRSIASKITMKASSEEEDESGEKSYDSDENVGIKSLEQIKNKTMARLGDHTGRSPVRERLGPAKVSEEEEQENSGRQILVSRDAPQPPKPIRKRPWSSARQQKAGTVEDEEGEIIDVSPKKVKKRPWSSVLPKSSVVHAAGEEDLRTFSATSPVEIESDSEFKLDPPESPFESLRRRAYLKKTQQLQDQEEQNESETKEEHEEEVAIKEDEETRGGKRKKHKHKHKRHKKSKSERKIYVPPGKKSCVVIGENLYDQNKKVKSPPSLMSINTVPEDFPEEGEIIMPAAPQRPKPKAAALWAAGLSLPAKGLGGRPRHRFGVSVEKEESLPLTLTTKPRPAVTTSKISSSLTSSSSSLSSRDNPVPVVKTFSQIMAEKRLKRLQTKGDDEKTVSGDFRTEGQSNSSSPSRVSSKMEESKPRVPITPITFDIDKKTEHPLRVRHAPSGALFGRASKSSPSSDVTITSHKAAVKYDSFSSSLPSTNSSTSMSDIRPTYKTARAKKLFKKTKPTSQTGDPTSDSQIDTPSESQALPSRDAVVDTAIKPLTEGRKQRKTSITTESHTNQITSLDDEFNFLDGGDMIDIGDIEGKELEPIDDLLQDIDDLLA